MAIGQKMGSLKTLKESMKKGGGGQFIKYIPKNGSMNVRFIEEPEEWVNYGEHWDSMRRKSYPCSEEASCPGCVAGERKSSRYLANAVDVDDKSKRVIPLQMPKDLANRLVIKYEKWGTLVDRDIELERAGEGLDTTYDLDAGPKDPINLGQYNPLDLLKVLDDAYKAVFDTPAADDDDDDDLPPPRPKQTRARGKSAAAKKAEAAAADVEVDDESDEEEEPPFEPDPPKKPAKKAAAKAKAPEPEFTPEVDDEPEEEEPEGVDEDDDEGEDDEWTEAALRALPLGALRRVARDDFQVDPKGKNADQIIDAIFEASEDDDEPPY